MLLLYINKVLLDITSRLILVYSLCIFIGLSFKNKHSFYTPSGLLLNPSGVSMDSNCSESKWYIVCKVWTLKVYCKHSQTTLGSDLVSIFNTYSLLLKLSNWQLITSIIKFNIYHSKWFLNLGTWKDSWKHCFLKSKICWNIISHNVPGQLWKIISQKIFQKK